MKTPICLLVIFVFLTIISCKPRQTVVILIPKEPSSVEILSAKEIRRYIYHRSNVLPDILKSDNLPDKVKNLIVIAEMESPVLKEIYPAIGEILGVLKKDGYYLKTVQYY